MLRYYGGNRGSRTQAGCGALFGLIPASLIWLQFFPDSLRAGILCGIVGMIVGAVAAYFRGDHHWHDPPT
jgi:hypothetical protein